MAEARSSSCVRVPPTLEEGRDSWRDLAVALRKNIARRYYRTRNSLRNGTWPTSTNNLLFISCVTLGLLLGEPEATRGVNNVLWAFAKILPLPSGSPRWLVAGVAAWAVGVAFFLVLMTVRQYLLRILLSYRGWLYEALRKPSKMTVAWCLAVKAVSGYQPSLYSFQRSLPRLPVPPLQKTLTGLLDSLAPLCTDEEMEDLRKEAAQFERTLGLKLQRILLLKSWWAPNYVTDWWEKYVYLSARTPISINSNYYGMDQSYWSPTKFQAARAAVTLFHVLQFKRKIDREELTPLLLRNTIPICMAQYERLFSSARIPGEEVDELVHVDSSESKHIVVSSKGILYILPVFDSKNQILSPLALEESLEWIIKDSHQVAKLGEEEERNVAAFTTLPRAEWAVVRKTILSSKTPEWLQTVERSILYLVLSTENPKTLSEKGKILLHGDGKTLWFDKSINLVFFQNGSCGLNVEHTMADAPVMGHVWEYAMTKEIIEKWYTDEGHAMPLPKSFRPGRAIPPTRLNVNLSSDLRNKVSDAIVFAQKNNSDVDLVVFDHKDWGKGFMKKCRMSPDAFVQAALQLAYYKDTGKLALTYEASMTRLYLSGRTETVRSCTSQLAAFVKSMVSDSLNREEKVKLLQTAANKHQELYRDSMNGRGVDRHLFALYVTCVGLENKSEFLEKILLRPWTLSTSQQPQQQIPDVPDANLSLFQDKVSPGGGFGPVSDDGYGISYMLPSDHKIFFHVASKHSAAGTSSTRFVQRIAEALTDIRSLFEVS